MMVTKFTLIIKYSYIEQENCKLFKINILNSKATPWIISSVVGALILGGYAFYFLRLKTK